MKTNKAVAAVLTVPPTDKIKMHHYKTFNLTMRHYSLH